jgi:hypothetical protein
VNDIEWYRVVSEVEMFWKYKNRQPIFRQNIEECGNNEL